MTHVDRFAFIDPEGGLRQKTEEAMLEELRRQATALRRTTLNHAVDLWRTALRRDSIDDMVEDLTAAFDHVYACQQELDWMLSECNTALCALRNNPDGVYDDEDEEDDD